MTQRLAPRQTIALRCTLLGWHAGLAGESGADGRRRRFGICGDGLHLAAIAGRQEHRLGEPGCLQPGEQYRLALFLDVESFAQGRRAATVVDADNEKLGHGRAYRNRARRSSSSASGTAVCSPLSRSRRLATPFANSPSPRMTAAAAG